LLGASGARTLFYGVLFQKQNLGEGFMVGPRHTGEVSLVPFEIQRSHAAASVAAE
jgi:hypothetical protein